MLKMSLSITERNKKKNIIHKTAKDNVCKTKTVFKLKNKKNKNKIQTYTALTYYRTVATKLATLFKNANLNIAYKKKNIFDKN